MLITLHEYGPAGQPGARISGTPDAEQMTRQPHGGEMGGHSPYNAPPNDEALPPQTPPARKSSYKLGYGQ